MLESLPYDVLCTLLDLAPLRTLLALSCTNWRFNAEASPLLPLKKMDSMWPMITSCCLYDAGHPSFRWVRTRFGAHTKRLKMAWRLSISNTYDVVVSGRWTEERDGRGRTTYSPLLSSVDIGGAPHFDLQFLRNLSPHRLRFCEPLEGQMYANSMRKTVSIEVVFLSDVGVRLRARGNIVLPLYVIEWYAHHQNFGSRFHDSVAHINWKQFAISVR